MVDVSNTEANVTETPSMAQVLQDAFEGRITDLHTAIPGEVDEYDSSTGTAKIKPLLKRKFKDGEVVDLPVLNQVPVVFPRTTTSYIHLPIKAGDVGLVVFSERSIDRYKNLGGSQDPQDPRKHSLSDGFFIPGGYPITTPPVSVIADALHFKNISSEIIMKENGEVEIKNAIGSFLLNSQGKVSITGLTGEIVDIISQHLAKDIAHTHASAVGPTGPPINVADYTALKVLVDGMKI